ncbi:MAG: tryptophan synthase subunit alpha [Deltaproteobacteria bacterium]|nr:tryptophan synthase subunit alpha [Deltaproteobacteria bacterium]
MKNQQIKIMSHLVAGYPSLAESEKIALAMAGAGVSYIEIQIPFSDPVADGPTIAAANRHALDRGTSVTDCFELMTRLKEQVSIPLLFMSYYNILFRHGVDAFCARAAAAGCWGLIVPDIPFDEEPGNGYLAACAKWGLNPILVISPITPPDRLRAIGEMAKGFVYCVSGFGITGQERNVSDETRDYLARARQYISRPLALGFGISSRDQIVAAAELADIVVIGSKIINLYNQGSETEGLKKIIDFLQIS